MSHQHGINGSEQTPQPAAQTLPRYSHGRVATTPNVFFMCRRL